jgi:hypothetical protein
MTDFQDFIRKKDERARNIRDIANPPKQWWEKIVDDINGIFCGGIRTCRECHSRKER